MIYHGDCLEVMRGMDAASVDAIVTDPPYGLSFMGKDWDHGIPGVPFWTEAFRVAKPGAHLLAFGGTRTFHRLTCAIEDAGWEIRDCLGWIYGSGFPKSLDVSKAIDKAAGAKREVVGREPRSFPDSERWGDPLDARAGGSKNATSYEGSPHDDLPGRVVTAPATDAARQWEGWGTALKPAWEPIILARKQLDGTVAANVQKWGTGAVNVDGCRVATTDAPRMGNVERSDSVGYGAATWQKSGTTPAQGRWPANLIHDGSEEVLELFPQTGPTKPHGGDGLPLDTCGQGWGFKRMPCELSDNGGSAARFFYCAKASRKEREMGCDGMPIHIQKLPGKSTGYNPATGELTGGYTGECRNHHPTVKPLALMRYLCRLATPPNGLVLDPFMGSGTTGMAAYHEDFRFIGIDNNAEYVEIARKRIAHVITHELLFTVGPQPEATA